MEAKGLFFSRLGNTFDADPSLRSYAVLNNDDPASSYFSKLTAAHIITYGIDNEADVRASDLILHSGGTEFMVDSFGGSCKIRMQMVGKFNVYNALGAIAATLAEGIPLAQITQSLEDVAGVEGRLEVVNEGQDFLVVVDYAHTPDGLENVLSALRGFARGKIICVFGCGGDRDRTKRPLMGGIAAKYSDYLIVTSDNPRSEDPDAILQDIIPGVLKEKMSGGRSYELDVDRRSAIRKAIHLAEKDDIVLIAGKGHETYQIIQGVSAFFDDRIEAREAIRSRHIDKKNIQ